METIQEDYFDLMYEPLAGSSLINLFKLLAQNKFRISLPYIPRMMYALVLSSVISPFRLKEHSRYHHQIKNTKPEKDPIFIIGHWRSGTTYLHNVLSEDPQYGFCSTFHATLPGVFLSSEKTLKPLLAASIPTTRPMDNVAMGPDLPQEEEYALANITPYGYYNGWCFPKNIRFYNGMIAIDKQPERIQEIWKETYQYFIQKLTVHRKGKHLLLKNPAHTARLNILLELYPEAKFIHIHRHPYEVFCSMKKFMRIVLPRYCLQTPPPMNEIEENIYQVYHMLYQSYLNQRTTLSENQLIEIAYDEFVADPIPILKTIYEQLHLNNYDIAEDHFKSYINNQKDFKTSNYRLSAQKKEQVFSRWRFAFDAFGYEN